LLWANDIIYRRLEGFDLVQQEKARGG
jgi:hypothetical protein